MKKLKITFWIVVLGLIGLVIVQNWEVFKVENSLRVIVYQTPPLANAVFFVIFFFFGLLAAYLVSLLKRFKDAKTIRALTARESQLTQAVADLEKQLAVHKHTTGFAGGEPVQGDVVEIQPIDVEAEVK